MMKTGYKVTCMCSADGKLTIYKTYEVHNEYLHNGVNKLLILNDSGDMEYIPQYCFIYYDEF